MSRPGTTWRTLLEDPQLAAEMFPSLAGLMARPTERRRVLKLLAASLALGGLAACDPASPERYLVPAVVAPPGIIPGLPNYFSTAAVTNGSALGIVVRHEMGRPIKVEGNPHHPSSLGATDLFAQALILDFYDPDRAAGVQHNASPGDWQAVLTALAEQRANLAQNHGAGFRILTGTVLSPTLAASIAQVLQRYPEARWHQWEPVSRDAVRAGAARAYGRPVDMLLHVEKADVILALDSDMLGTAPGHVRYAREFAARRNPVRAPMSRVYAAEPVPTLIGTAGDHRFPTGPREMHKVLLALRAEILGGEAPSDAPGWVAKAAKDLKNAHGHALIHLGPQLPAEAHALAHAMNEALGGRGATYDLIEPVESMPTDQGTSLRALQQDMQSGRVNALLILDSNPVYTAPGFADALKQVKFSMCVSPMPDETAAVTTWYVPMTHQFESWGDARAHDGTATIQQPQALPLYGGRSAPEVLSLVAGSSFLPTLEAVRQTWKDRLGDNEAWRDALAHGVVPGTAQPKAGVSLRQEARTDPPAPPDRAVTVLFRPDPSLWDGRWANNAWLEELPRPLTKLTWDNPLLISPSLAHDLKIGGGNRVTLSIGQTEMTVPVWVMPGQADDCVVAWLGSGRRLAGEVGNGAGFDFYPLRAATGTVSLKTAEGSVALATTDHRDPLQGKFDDILRHGTISDFRKDPTFLKDKKTDERPEGQIYTPHYDAPVQWGMSVDLNACIGCNACVVACMAENNVPVVGKEMILREREMHWLRIDRYYDGGADDPDAYFQPMFCQHCEEAPCEIVCPVEAAVHDHEGLNLQVYNRCIGTRFCSNNCPYKVRRFNFFHYAATEHRPPIARNPDVSVRGRGVMEKCTFCVQRIAEARIAHDRYGAPERAVTACQAACPTRVFTFGNVADPASEVSLRKQSPLDYEVLHDQGTHPRVTYEARIRNPNPEIGA